MFAGYKTYIVGTLAVLGAIGAWASGDLSLADAAQTVITAILGMTIRHGISTANA